MDANQINMVAVGLEQLGADDFMTGKFFDGEVYIDEGKKTYRELGYKRFSFLSIWTAILSRISRASIAEARRRGISGNLSGDGLQNGGMLIVSKSGTRVLLNHREELPGDHVANDEILRVLGITEVLPSDPETSDRQQESESQPPCEEECDIPPPPKQ